MYSRRKFSGMTRMMTRIYVATSQHFGVLLEEDNHWNVQLTLQNAGIQCLAVDPADCDIVYAGSRGQGVFKSVDAGMSWQRLPFPEQDVFSLAVSPADGAIYAGCEPSKLFRSRDGGMTWTELTSLQDIPSKPTWSFPPRPWTSHVSWIAPNPHDADILLVGIELGGVMYTEDGGNSWRDHPDEAIRDCHALAWHPTAKGRAYQTGGGGPAAWSEDGALTWERLETGTDRFYGWALAVDPYDPDCWYMSASPSAGNAHSDHNAQAYIYRWQNDGPWVPLTGETQQPLNVMPYALYIYEGVLYAGFRDGSLQYSLDQGETWRTAKLTGDRLASIRAMAVVEA